MSPAGSAESGNSLDSDAVSPVPVDATADRPLPGSASASPQLAHVFVAEETEDGDRIQHRLADIRRRDGVGRISDR